MTRNEHIAILRQKAATAGHAWRVAQKEAQDLKDEYEACQRDLAEYIDETNGLGGNLPHTPKP